MGVQKKSARAMLMATALGAGVAAALPQIASAQAETQVDEVIVTATRREQRLQDVPVAVTAVSGEELAQSGVREVTDIQYLAPNVSFSSTNPTANGGGYQIRGVGTQSYLGGVEQTVGLVVDGVVVGLSRDPGATGFSDIERIEVLRGPQGTLFGKNTSAGVIQIVTRGAQLGETSGDLTLAYGERNEVIARSSANLPIGDAAAVRLSAFYQSQEGAIPNLLNKWHVGDRESWGVRAKLRWEPSNALVVQASVEHQEGFSRDAHTLEALGTNPLFNAQFNRFAIRPGPGVLVSFQDADWSAKTKLDAASLQVDYRLGEHTLTSITGYRAVETLQLADIDAAPINIFNNSDGGVDSSQVTQEVRLTSPSGERLEYVVGAYYYGTDITGWAAQYGNFYGLFGRPVVLGGGRRDEKVRNRSLAAFGQGTYALTETLKVIAGLRYTHDQVRGSMRVTPLPFPSIPSGVTLPYSGEVEADDLSGRIGLQYQPHRDLMFFATYATGYKGPAIDGTGGVVREIKPETVESYEAGVKSTLLDGRMTLNGTVYLSDFSDFQAQALDSSVSPPSFVMSNAGLMRAKGVEVESTLRLTPELTLSANAAYNDAKYKDYFAACYAGQPVSPVAGVGCYVDPATGLQVANYSGERLANAPQWSYMLRGSYERPLANGLVLDASAMWSWRSEAQSITADPRSVVDSYGLLNATVGISGERWRLSLYGRNLLDEQFYAPYPSGTLNPGGYYRIVSPDAFRTVGIQLKLDF
jgi:iron complex outermembrane receptor protein